MSGHQSRPDPDAGDPMTLQWYGVFGGLVIGLMSPDPFLFTLPTVMLGFICMDHYADSVVRPQGKGRRKGIVPGIIEAFGRFVLWLMVGGALTFSLTYMWGILT